MVKLKISIGKVILLNIGNYITYMKTWLEFIRNNNFNKSDLMSS